MKTIYIIGAIVAIVIIIGGVFAYTAMQNPASTPSPSPSAEATPSTNPTQTAQPTSSASPTETQTSSPTSNPTSSPTSNPTTSPTNSPTSAPTNTPTSNPTNSPTPTQTTAPTASPTPAPTLSAATLNGAGATFPQPFINATIVYYTTNIRTNLQINYPGGGSGAGVQGLTQKTVDFACSDAALTAAQTAALTSQAVTIPETIGAITIAYYLPGIANGQLHLTGAVLADIYLGTITNWNDPAITALNPGLSLPNHAITTVHRSESSGTTKWFTQYLSIVSPQWNSSIGYANSVQWPSGIGQSGNPGVAQAVNSTQYAIGYVELAYALQNGLTVAAMQNPAGNYIVPSLATTTAAAQALPTSGLPSSTGDWTGVNILNSSGDQAYPICNPTYMLIYKDLGVVPGMDMNKATQLIQWVWYVIHDGQSLASGLQYAPLPSNIVQYDEATIQSITFNGQTIPIS
jgi:phosphate ABC transporter phosphate-binding protein